MKVSMNGIEYTANTSKGLSTVTWSTGSFTGHTTKAKAIREAVMNPMIVERDKLLLESDWRMTIDYPNDDQQVWKDYRKALRDLPSTYVQGEDISLPTKP